VICLIEFSLIIAFEEKRKMKFPLKIFLHRKGLDLKDLEQITYDNVEFFSAMKYLKFSLYEKDYFLFFFKRKKSSLIERRNSTKETKSK